MEYGKNHVFLTKDDLMKAIETRRGKKDDGTSNTWDVSAIDDMSYLFYGNEFFNDNISNWDVSNVTTMVKMFGTCFFDQDIGTWNVSNVTTMKGMFDNSFKGPHDPTFNQDISKWNVSKVTNMEGIFYNSKFNHPLPWNTSSVTTMKKMFENSQFNHPLSWNVSNVTDMEEMFYKSVFNHPLDWDTSSVTTMKRMFSRSHFNQPLNFNISKVTDMEGMFSFSPFNQPLTWDITNVKNMTEMFSGSKFNQDISTWDVSTKETKFMFEGNSMKEKYKPNSISLTYIPHYSIKNTVTISIYLHGKNLTEPLKDKLPSDFSHMAIAGAYGLCRFIQDITVDERLKTITHLKEVYQGKIKHGNDVYLKEFTQGSTKKAVENHEKILMQETPYLEFEQLKQLYEQPYEYHRGFLEDRYYTIEDDSFAKTMGIFIINEKIDGVNKEREYANISCLPEYQELQKLNLINVEVAKQILPDGLPCTIEDNYTGIPHYNGIRLSDILIYFKKMGYDYVNILDHGCRGENISIERRRTKSMNEHTRYDRFFEQHPIGGKRLEKRQRKTQKNHLSKGTNKIRHKTVEKKSKKILRK